MDDEAAWEAYAGNKTVLQALHESQCAAMEEGMMGVLTPPVSPREKKGRAQERSNGEGLRRIESEV
jgi:hypothetical protein